MGEDAPREKIMSIQLNSGKLTLCEPLVLEISDDRPAIVRKSLWIEAVQQTAEHANNKKEDRRFQKI